VIRAVAIIVPARNEEALIGRCLSAIYAARTRALDVDAIEPVRIDIVVVADACTDETAAIARSVAGVKVIEIDAGAVGSARATGTLVALDSLCPQDEEFGTGYDADDVWLAHTDADSVVPPNWVVEQLALAGRGVDLVLGTVRPDLRDLSPAHAQAWHENRHPAPARGHIYGANLGIRASHYLRAGGFAPLAEHEDVDLVDRVCLAGSSTFATDIAEVMTSGRHHGRTPGGFARYLRVDLLARAVAVGPAPDAVSP